MRQIGPSRRTFLAGLGATVLPFKSGEADASAACVACCRRHDGTYAAAILSEDGDVLSAFDLDGRGHAAAVRKDPATAVVFARRPGRFAVVIDVDRRRALQAVAPPANRRFAGHGFFSADGRLLFAAENDFGGERGVLGIYDATDGYSRLGEFDTHGIGPHEALLLADGRTIAVANGGILTHPDYPRQKLNLATMARSLTLLDAASGDLLAKATLPPAMHQLCIRHMAEVAPGTLWFGAQHEGPRTIVPPLVGRFERDRGLSLMPRVKRSPWPWHTMSARWRRAPTASASSPRAREATSSSSGMRSG